MRQRPSGTAGRVGAAAGGLWASACRCQSCGSFSLTGQAQETPALGKDWSPTCGHQGNMPPPASRPGTRETRGELQERTSPRPFMDRSGEPSSAVTATQWCPRLPATVPTRSPATLCSRWLLRGKPLQRRQNLVSFQLSMRMEWLVSRQARGQATSNQPLGCKYPVPTSEHRGAQAPETQSISSNTSHRDGNAIFSALLTPLPGWARPPGIRMKTDATGHTVRTV